MSQPKRTLSLRRQLANISGKIHVSWQRVKFTLRKRKDGETVTQFLSALWAIAGNCSYGNSLNERLRDQLVLGINNDAWQQEIFRLHTITIQQV